MTEWLLRRFAGTLRSSDPQNMRTQYGMFSGVVGLVCNLVLFAFKLTAGLLMHSIAVVSDAFNNLSDGCSCIITLAGYRLAGKPADRKHPFGHGRMEYLVSLSVSLLIVLSGFELLRSSFERLFIRSQIIFQPLLFVFLVLSAAVKLWMRHFYTTVGNRIRSDALLASAQDAGNDVLATSIAVAAMLLNAYTASFPFDAAAGLFVSGMIMLSGFQIGREILDRLLGTPADRGLADQIGQMILTHREIRGMHDLMIHDYGPGTQIASAHVEIDQNMPFFNAHKIADEIENEIFEKMHVEITLHMDPVETDNPLTAQYQEKAAGILSGFDRNIRIQDFHAVYGDDSVNLMFEAVVPYNSQADTETMRSALRDAFRNENVTVIPVFKHSYTGEDAGS